jgi:coenzyme F420-reducing hydrogenase beta subunit
MEHVGRFYTSKYVQSNILECYEKTADSLQMGYPVLFSGTPCQLAAIRSYLGKEYENLILVECACHGVPSPKVWKKYLAYLSEHCLVNEQINHVNFRSKIDGRLFSLLAQSAQHMYKGWRQDDAYLKGFLNNLTLRPSCTVCGFKGPYRTADITLADFWGLDKVCPELSGKDGYSMVFINSLKGKKLWNAVTGMDLYVQEVDIHKVINKVNSAIWKPVTENNNRRVFFNSIDNIDIKKALDLYAVPQKKSFAVRAFNKVKRVLRKHALLR